MLIRDATEEDNLELLRLTQSCPMNGVIELLIDRQPDFLSLLKIKGDYKVFVAEADSKIIGSFALVTKEAYINREQEKIGYLCDLKVAPSHRNTLAAFRLLKAMYTFMQSLPIDFYLCVVSKGNHAVEKLLMGRAGIPAAFKAADFSIFQFLPLRKPKQSRYQVKKFEKRFQAQAVSLLNQYYREYQFASVLTKDSDIEGDIAWMVVKNDELVAFLSLVNMDAYKQNIVLSIPNYLRALLMIIRFIWPHIKIAKENEPIKMLHVKYLAYTPQCELFATALINQARYYAHTEGYSFVSYGLDSRNSLVPELSSIPNITFRSSGYVFDFCSASRWIKNSLCHDNFYKV